MKDNLGRVSIRTRARGKVQSHYRQLDSYQTTNARLRGGFIPQSGQKRMIIWVPATTGGKIPTNRPVDGLLAPQMRHLVVRSTQKFGRETRMIVGMLRIDPT